MRHLPRLLIATILIIITTAVVAKAEQSQSCSFYDSHGVYQGQLDLNIRNRTVQHLVNVFKCPFPEYTGVLDQIEEIDGTITFAKSVYAVSGFIANRGCSVPQSNQLTPVTGALQYYDGETQVMAHVQATWKGDILMEFNPQRITVGRDVEYTIRNCRTF